jgi:hypothetical protein
LQQTKTHAQPPPKQMKMSGVQAVIKGEDRNVNNVYNTDHLLITCDNETDIFISKSTKDTIWNLKYNGLSLLLRHNFNYQSVKYNFLSLGKLIMHLTNKHLKVKQFDSLDIWTYAFINNANGMIDRHPLLAGYLLLYMSILSGDVVDSPFSSADQYDQQFRLELHTIKPEHGLKLMAIYGYNVLQKGR